MTGQPYITEKRWRFHAPALIRIPWSYLITGSYILSRGDNASFLHDATEDYRGKPVPKLTRARWRRVLRRNLATTVPAVLLTLTPTSWMSLQAVKTYVVLLMIAALAWLVLAGRGSLVDRRLNREWRDPAARVLCSVLNIRYIRRRARAMVDIPKDWGSGEAKEDSVRQTARIVIPAGTALSAGLKKQIEQNVGARLGIPAPVTADWREAGSLVCAELSAAPVPPKDVTYAGLQKAIQEAGDDEIVIGRGAGGRIIKLSLVEDSPHFLASGAAGTGKSALMRVILRQRIERGDGVVITDPKRFSHIRWAGKLPRERVVYAYRDEDLHEAWLAIGAESKRRIALPTDELEHQRRVFVVAEELNAQIKILARYWKKRRQEIMRPARAQLSDAVKACGGSAVDGLQMALDDGLDPADLDPPVISPAIVALQETVFMGRELRMHMLAAAQRASAGVFGGGGGDVRESFQGGRMIARWDRKLWKMLVDTIAYVACPPGRLVWGLARGEDFDIFRIPWTDESEMATACELAIPVHGPVLGQQDGHVGQSERVAIGSAVTLAMAIDQLPGQDGPHKLSMSGLKSAANRDGFPRPLAKPDGSEYGKIESKLYWLDDLIEWREGALARKG